MNEKINGGIMDNRNYTELYAALQKETTILTAQIRALYRNWTGNFIFAEPRFQSHSDSKQTLWVLIQEQAIMKKNTFIFLFSS